jgi:hypothetical protein
MRGEADAAPAPKAAPKSVAAASGGARPVLPPGISQLFVPPRGSGGDFVYHAAVLGETEVFFRDAKSGVAATEKVARVVPVGSSLDWSGGEEPDFAPEDLEAHPSGGAGFAELAAPVGEKAADAWAKDFATWLYRENALELWKSPSAGAVSKPGESEAGFRARLQQEARERRDADADKLRQKYGAKLASLQERLRRAEQTVGREKQESMQAGVQTAISVGATVLGALFGRKAVSSSTIGRATTAARSAGRTMKQSGDVQRAEESAEAVRRQIQELEAELEAELAARSSATDPLTEKLERVSVRPKKSDITVRPMRLVWRPYRGNAPAWS